MTFIAKYPFIECCVKGIPLIENIKERRFDNILCDDGARRKPCSVRLSEQSAVKDTSRLTCTRVRSLEGGLRLVSV